MADISQLNFNNTLYNLKDSEARSAIAALPSSMIFKGTLGTDGTITTLPAASSTTVGYVYKVITDGTYASISAKVGDMFICSDTPEWTLVPSGDEPSGTVTNIATGTGLTGGPITTSGTISLADSGVKAGTYQGITVDSMGRVTQAEDAGYATNSDLDTTKTDLSAYITKVETNLSSHASNQANPHSVTKAQIGLSDVDNTSDLNKPISTATQSALDKKLDSSSYIVDSTLSTTSTNPVQNKVISDSLNSKVDKIDGKSLSTNDFTDTLMAKLDGISEGANKTTVSDSLTDTSTTNALSANQGRILNDAIASVNNKLGTQVTYSYSSGNLTITTK